MSNVISNENSAKIDCFLYDFDSLPVTIINNSVVDISGRQFDFIVKRGMQTIVQYTLLANGTNTAFIQRTTNTLNIQAIFTDLQKRITSGSAALMFLRQTYQGDQKTLITFLVYAKQR